MNKSFAKHSSSAGFTLVELLIYFALISILFVQVTTLFLSVLESKQAVHSVSMLERDGEYMLSRLVMDLQRADSVTAPASLGEVTNTLQLVIAGETYAYGIIDEHLTLTKNGEILELSPTLVVSNLQITRLGNVSDKPSFRVQFTATSPIEENTGQKTKMYQTTVGMR